MISKLSIAQIVVAQGREALANCFPAIQELRPKLRDERAFVDQILRQNQQNYTLVYIQEKEEVVACMGFRIMETLAWGKILYIDDLITREKSRKQGYGKALLTYAIEQAKLAKCAEVHLDTGHHRHDAHRLYLNMGFVINCHHLGLAL